MKRFSRITVFLLLTVAPGCLVTGVLEVDGLKPATITISKSIQSLVVVSVFELSDRNKLSLETTSQLADFISDSIAANHVVVGCSDALAESPRFKLLKPALAGNQAGESTVQNRPISWGTVSMIAGIPAGDAVLSLELAVIRDSIARSLPYNWQSTYQYIICLRTFWRLYRLKDCQTVDLNFTDTVAYEINYPGEVMFSPQLRGDFVRDALYVSGVRTARRLAPWWVIFERDYFATGPRKFKNVAKLLNDGKWKEAAEMLRPFTESSNKLLAAKACFNMALVCEMANNIPAALEWLNKSSNQGMDEQMG